MCAPWRSSSSMNCAYPVSTAVCFIVGTSLVLRLAGTPKRRDQVDLQWHRKRLFPHQARYTSEEVYAITPGRGFTEFRPDCSFGKMNNVETLERSVHPDKRGVTLLPWPFPSLCPNLRGGDSGQERRQQSAVSDGLQRQPSGSAVAWPPPGRSIAMYPPRFSMSRASRARGPVRSTLDIENLTGLGRRV